MAVYLCVCGTLDVPSELVGSCEAVPDEVLSEPVSDDTDESEDVSEEVKSLDGFVEEVLPELPVSLESGPELGFEEVPEPFREQEAIETLMTSAIKMAMILCFMH